MAADLDTIHELLTRDLKEHAEIRADLKEISDRTQAIQVTLAEQARTLDRIDRLELRAERSAEKLAALEPLPARVDKLADELVDQGKKNAKLLALVGVVVVVLSPLISRVLTSL